MSDIIDVAFATISHFIVGMKSTSSKPCCKQALTTGN